jgi:hypothetical protein
LADTDKGELLSGTTIKAIYPFILSLGEFMELYSEEEDK